MVQAQDIICFIIAYMLGAICGSAQSMDQPAQSMDPLSSIVCADIHGCLRNLWILRRMQIISLQ